MDAIKEALKRHMQKHDKPVTNAPHDKVDQNHGDVSRGDPAKSEHAPELDPGEHAHMAVAPTETTPADSGLQEQHQQILQALMGQGGHHGRPAMSLKERVADNAKGKYDSMKGKC